MQNKKGLMATTLVVIIIMMVVFVVLMRLDLHILALLRATSEGGICAWSAIFSSFTRTPVGTETLKIVCPQRYVSVFMTQNEIKDIESKNKKEEYFDIDKPIPSSLRKKLAEWYPGPDFKDKNIYRKYRMNEIMAKEMKSCWGKLGRGELNLFSDWFRLLPVTYKKETFEEDDAIFKRMLKGLQFWRLEGAASRRVCVICSRVRFSSQVKNQYMGEITDLGEWMRNHPVNVLSPKPLSYYEFLLDETIPSDFFAPGADQNRFYYTTDKDQAIVFMRMNIHALVKGLSKISDVIGISDEVEAIDAVFITPYDEVINKCGAIVN